LSTVAITAEIKSDPDLIGNEITLERLDEFNQPIELLGYLHDDGLGGDLIAGDDIYTLEANFNEPETTEIKFRIFAGYITTPTTISSYIFAIDAVIPISEDDFGTTLEVEEGAIQKFERLKEQYSDDVARQLTIDWLKIQYGVEDASISSDNYTIWILFTSGLEGGITTHPIGTRGKGGKGKPPKDSPTKPPAIPETVNAIVLAPFFDEFTSDGGDESDYIAEKLSQLWSPVSTIKHSAVTVDLMKTLHQYAVVSIASHGAIDDEDQVLIFTGEEATPENRKQHEFGLRAGRIREYIVNGNYAITPSFIEHYGGKYPKSLIYIAACSSMENRTMANAFLNKGVYTYFGYNDTVNTPFAYSIGTRLFDYLLEDRMTTGNAYTALGKKRDPQSPHARFLLAGGDDLVLAEIPIITDETPTGEIENKKPTIQAKIYSPSNIDINLSTIVMTLDGSEITPTITPQAGGSDITISYTPSIDLEGGEHTVTINAKDAIALVAEEKTWSFVVKYVLVTWEETWQGTPFTLSGSKTWSTDGLDTVQYSDTYIGDSGHEWLVAVRADAYASNSPDANSYAKYDFTVAISGDVSWNVEGEAYTETIQNVWNSASFVVIGFGNYKKAYLSHDFPYYNKVTENTEITWTGSENGQLVVTFEDIYGGFTFATLETQGTYALSEWAGKRIDRIRLAFDEGAGLDVHADVLGPPPLSDFDSGNNSAYYGPILITNIEQ
ncbi:MAG: hypothetical protein NG740_05185, partial [Omnitrophica bacterium]|nr:hypothetical protein [Candidatus Omnitrophota bacterium]